MKKWKGRRQVVKLDNLFGGVRSTNSLHQNPYLMMSMINFHSIYSIKENNFVNT